MLGLLLLTTLHASLADSLVKDKHEVSPHLAPSMASLDTLRLGLGLCFPLHTSHAS